MQTDSCRDDTFHQISAINFGRGNIDAFLKHPMIECFQPRYSLAFVSCDATRIHFDRVIKFVILDQLFSRQTNRRKLWIKAAQPGRKSGPLAAGNNTTLVCRLTALALSYVVCILHWVLAGRQVAVVCLLTDWRIR